VTVRKEIRLSETDALTLEKILNDKVINDILTLYSDDFRSKLSQIVKLLCWCYEDDYCRKYLYEAFKLAVTRRPMKIKTLHKSFIEEKSPEESQKRLREIEEQVRKAKEMGII